MTSRRRFPKVSKLILLSIAALGISACASNDSQTTPLPIPAARLMDASQWEIGPIFGGTDYSIGLPVHPTSAPDGTWYFVLSPDSEAHYITFPYGSLSGKSSIHIKLKIESSDPTAYLYGLGQGCSPTPTAITLYFQRRGDTWQDGDDGWRWWATFASHQLANQSGSLPTEFEIDAPLTGPDAKWTSINTKTWSNAPQDLAAAITNADRVGFTFANCSGYGHGARASAQVKISVESFTIN